MLAASLATAATDAQATPDYNSDVRPILSRNCFQCHGPDEQARKADLRLDVAGHGKEAEILRRIASPDAKTRMPPPRSNKTLETGHIDTIRRWIADGARYANHWAFVPPRMPALPAGEAEGAIDRFVQARLRSAGLRPSPEADRWTLVRRLYLDLIGLPPTPTEADAFVQDRRPDALEQLVDRLLASPAYGERWARRWLDLARYADSNGYEKDRPRSIWPYRDWVIRAIESDMPFDRFVVEQLAGDMLPDATPSQVIATGFHRNTMLNEEGGIDPLEFRFHAMTDRVATTGTALLGLTLGCAQCHTHKFDPITHREYYGLMAFLNNADEPEYEVPDQQRRKREHERHAQAKRRLQSLASRWPAKAGALDDRFRSWLAERRKTATRWSTRRPIALESNLPTLRNEDQNTVFVTGDTTKHDRYRVSFSGSASPVGALRLEALPDPRLPARGPGTTYYEGRKGDFFLSELRVLVRGKPQKIARASHSYAKNGFGRNPVAASLCIDGDLQTGWSTSGASGRRHIAVFELERALPAGAEFVVEMHFGRHFASSLGRFRISTSERTRGPADAGLSPKLEALVRRPADRLDQRELGQLREAFLLQAAEVAKESQEIRKLLRPARYERTLVMRERPKDDPRRTHRHHRGEWLQPRERIVADVPSMLHAWPDGLPRNRLGFARWLVSPKNPLMARVVVNRHWAAFFGRGLVRTIEDFGTQGEVPSHPELLDWLALTFIRDGWSRKRLHRRIVLSRTYRQGSHVLPEHRRKDPGNRWLARMPRLRLEGEVVRDAALRAAGLLSAKRFGPPVRPPQPPGVTEVAYGKPKWKVSRGEARYRRSIYTFVKRTAPFALYTTFDAPSGEFCVARRERSNTALQALTLLNDPMLQEAALNLGRRLARDTSLANDAARVRRGFRTVLTRPPLAHELARIVRFARRQLAHFESAPAVAQKLANDKASDAVAVAAWTSVARAIFALDEAITRN